MKVQYHECMVHTLVHDIHTYISYMYLHYHTFYMIHVVLFYMFYYFFNAFKFFLNQYLHSMHTIPSNTLLPPQISRFRRFKINLKLIRSRIEFSRINLDPSLDPTVAWENVYSHFILFIPSYFCEFFFFSNRNKILFTLCVLATPHHDTHQNQYGNHFLGSVQS